MKRRALLLAGAAFAVVGSGLVTGDGPPSYIAVGLGVVLVLLGLTEPAER